MEYAGSPMCLAQDVNLNLNPAQILNKYLTEMGPDNQMLWMLHINIAIVK